MADSDDYLFDDVEFDDTTLAALDEVEKSYLSTTQITHHVSPPTTPPAKRQKTTHTFRGHVKNRETRRVASFDDLEDLPDISVQDDGSYGIGSKLGNVVASRKSGGISGAGQGMARIGMANISRTTHQGAPSSSSSNAYGGKALVSMPSAKDIATNQINTPQDIQYKELKKQFEELQKRHAQLQSQLQQAEDAKLVKEGEVSVLRKGMEKTVRDHSNELAKLRAAKEEADAKQKQYQREIKEEMERLKTQLVFRQQEYQSAIHGMKMPGSARSRRITNDLPSTPLPASQSKGWNNDSMNIPGPSNRAFETPRRPRRDTVLRNASPKPTRTRLYMKSPETMRKSAMLPGFENAFMPSSPVKRTHSQSKGKGKQKAVEALNEHNFHDFDHENVDMWQQPDTGLPSSPIAPDPTSVPGDMDVDNDQPTNTVAEQDRDVMMTDGPPEVQPEELLDGVEPFDWGAELSRIISTHTTAMSTVLTLQILIGVNLPSNLDAQILDRYRSACAIVIRSLANNAEHIPYQKTLDNVATSLVDMLPILTSANLILPLASLLDLLASLELSLPTFSTLLLSYLSEGTNCPAVITHLKTIIKQCLMPAAQLEHKQPLAKAAIGLLEALCWNVTEESVLRLAAVPLDPDTIPILLDRSQPESVLVQAIHLLILLATHSALRRPLLSVTDASVPTNVPLIERLSTYLVDQREGPETDHSRKLLINFFGTLVNSEMISVLRNSHMLIPALIAYISHLVSLIWEDDEKYLAEPMLAESVIESLAHALLLLHHLIFSSQPPTDLLTKLQQAPPRYFNGANHVFIVAFGRLSYADPPSWMEKSTALALERVVDMARELLELMVDGPEGDAIWEVYQGDFEGISETDEEDMEAQLLGTTASNSKDI